jgi:CRISPR-associated protein Cas5d
MAIASKGSLLQTLEVWGPYACFTRPEAKTERFTYPVITPSAARAIFDAIFYRPSFYWQVERIELLAVPKYLALVRNEVKEKLPSAKTIASWMEGKAEVQPILVDGTKTITGNDGKGRTQRQTVMLKDVRYRLHARQILRKGSYSDDPLKLASMFERRARNGQCFHQPFFGCREFAAWFEYRAPSDPMPAPVDYSESVGMMLYDTFDIVANNDRSAASRVSFFDATIRGGILDVPPIGDPRVFKAPA